MPTQIRPKRSLTTLAFAGLLLVLAAPCALALGNTLFPNVSSWGTTTPSTVASKVVLHLGVHCFPDKIVRPCSVTVTLPVGSTMCTICQTLANAINSSAECFQQGYRANVGGYLLFVSINTHGSYLCHNPHITVDPVYVTLPGPPPNTSQSDLPNSYYFKMLGTGSGVPLDPGQPASLSVAWVGKRLGGFGTASLVAEVPATAGMTGSQISLEIAHQFRDAGIGEVLAEGDRIRFDVPGSTDRKGTVEIGDPGNSADDAASGSVPYSFGIGITEVTNADYAEFLNAVAMRSDPHGLYDLRMGSDPRGGIYRFDFDRAVGDSMPLAYAARLDPERGGPPAARGDVHLNAFVVKENMANKPVNFVSWLDAARFVNWLENGRPPDPILGPETESGAYDLSLPSMDSRALRTNQTSSSSSPINGARRHSDLPGIQM